MSMMIDLDYNAVNCCIIIIVLIAHWMSYWIGQHISKTQNWMSISLKSQ